MFLLLKYLHYRLLVIKKSLGFLEIKCDSNTPTASDLLGVLCIGEGAHLSNYSHIRPLSSGAQMNDILLRDVA